MVLLKRSLQADEDLHAGFWSMELFEAFVK
jgi:hypothetical protein